MAVVVGADVGGTSTRVVVAGGSAVALALRSGPGANPNRVGPGPAAERVRTTIGHALSAAGVEAGEVVAVSVALAGSSRVVSDPTTLAAYLDGISPAGLPVRPTVVADVAAAYAAGSAAAHGTVLVAGTGSIAAEVDHGRVLRRRGGWGWLLGDEGSGQWLGREALRVVVGRLERGEPGGALGEVVAGVLGAGSPEPTLETLLACAYEGPASRLAGLGAPVALLAGVDPDAAEVTRRAAVALVDLVSSVTPPRSDRASPSGPEVVLAGSVLAPGSVVGGLVRQRLAGLGVRPATARAGVVGATWLAVTAALEPTDPQTAHSRLAASVAALEREAVGGVAVPVDDGPRRG